MFSIPEELKKLPDKPGVYIMKNEAGEIIYVGKAIVLKNRVRQYFQSSKNHSPRIQAMVSKIHEFEYIVTDSELEALILECNLIKKHRPKYNILLKDDKSYPYLKVTMNEDYPRLILTRRYEKDGGKYFGPYANVYSVKEVMNLIKKIFPLKTCNKVLPRDIAKTRPCLNFYIHQCLAPCQGDVNKEEYRNMMKDICDFLDGKQEELIRRLQKSMERAAENLEFEKAADLRNKLTSLRLINEKQKVITDAQNDTDIIAFARDNTDTCIQMFYIRGGKLIGKEQFFLDNSDGAEESELIGSFVKQFYNNAPFIPDEVMLQKDIDEINIIERWLSKKKGLKIHLKVPKKGEKLQLVEMASKNAEIALQSFKERISREQGFANDGLERLRTALKLENTPQRIEVYDISNTGLSEMVASMVVLENGKLNKKEYRKFKIKSLSQQNDYGAMQEVIFRRFKHAEAEQKTDSAAQLARNAFAKLPDLIFVDGGTGHVNAVKSVLKELNIYIPLWGMVKDDKHRTKALVSEGREIDLRNNIRLLRMITMLQDEAHRFAVEFNRKLREKRYTVSALDEIDGVGPKRKKALLKHFGSIGRIREADINELKNVEGMTASAAEKVYEYFH